MEQISKDGIARRQVYIVTFCQIGLSLDTLAAAWYAGGGEHRHRHRIDLPNVAGSAKRDQMERIDIKRETETRVSALTNYRLKPVDSFATESRSAAEAA